MTDWIDMEGTSHPLRGKLIDAPYIKHLPEGEYTIAQALKDAGYETWHVGKWHLGGREYYPDHFGFDVNIGGCSWGHPHEGYFSPYGIETLPEGPEGEYLTDRITDEAVRLLKERKAGGSRKPFYMNLCHYAVHTPIQVKDEDRERFEKKAREQGLDQETALVEGEFHHTEDKKGRRVVRRVIQSDPSYAGMIWNLDQNIGRLLEALSECGEEENTVVVFTSDNGGLATSEGSPTCNLPASEGKGWVYEGGTRVPLIVKYRPRISIPHSWNWPAYRKNPGFPSTEEASFLCWPVITCRKGLSSGTTHTMETREGLLPLPLFWETTSILSFSKTDAENFTT